MSFLFGKRKQQQQQQSQQQQQPRDGTPPNQQSNGARGGSASGSLSSLNGPPVGSPDSKLPPGEGIQNQQPQGPTQPGYGPGQPPAHLQGPPQIMQRPSTSSGGSGKQIPANLYPWSQKRLVVSGTNSPFPRLNHAANGIAGKDGEIYLLGGQVSRNALNDLWIIDGYSEKDSPSVSAHPVQTLSDGPGQRSGHASLLVGNAFIVFGGDTRISENDRLDDSLYLLNTTTKQWARAIPGSRPAGRYGHTLNIILSKLYVFGGQVDGHLFNDLCSFDLNTLQQNHSRWETVIPAREGGPDIPAARTNHTIVTYDDKLYLFGGTNFQTCFNDVWSYDPQINQWTQLDCIGYVPSPREGHAAALVNDVMYIFGGRKQCGTDEGDLAAFRITTRRWYTFQRMGPSPTPRSGHSMTTFGSKIFVLGGEPSSEVVKPEEHQYVYVLETNKIRYPADNTGSPPAQRAMMGRPPPGTNGSFSNPPGQVLPPQSRNTPQQSRGTPRESVIAQGASQQQSGTPQGSSRLPRASAQQASSGPPPQQQGPPPRTNGIPQPGSRSRTPTRNEGRLQEKPSKNDLGTLEEQPSASQSREAAPVRRTSISLQNASQVQNSRDRAISESAANGPPQFQERSRSRQRAATNGNIQYQDQETASPADSEKVRALEQEVDQLKKQNAWFSSELALARRAGYSTISSNESSDQRRVSEPLQDADRPLMEGLVALKLELSRVYSQLDAQAADTAKKMSEVERQRDAAVQEAVYAKARLAAAGSNAGGNDGQRGGGSPEENLSERLAEANKKLNGSLAIQQELKKRVEVLEAEIESEKRARELADETSTKAQERVIELDNFRNQSASEIAELRLELLDAEKAYREESTGRADAEAEAKQLKLDKEDLEARLARLTESQKTHIASLTSLRDVVASSQERADTLESQLEEERSQREALERKLHSIKADYEAQSAELESVSRRLREKEELVNKYSDEAKASQAAVMAGLAKIAESAETSSTASDERVVALQQQVESARALLQKSKTQADESGERLAQAMQRIAGLEYSQAQSSRDSIALRRRMGEMMEEVKRLKSENESHKARLQEKTLELDTTLSKYHALKEILSDRPASLDKRRSMAVPSPSSGTATPEQLNRLREVELQLEESLRAHRETKYTAEMQAAEIQKSFAEKVEQLENDYKSAVHYVKQTEKMLKRMKDELGRYKERVSTLETERNDARDALQKLRTENTAEAEADWAQERDLLHREIDELRRQVRDSATALETQLRDTRSQLDSLRLERDSLKLELNRVSTRLKSAESDLAESRAASDRLTHERDMLELRLSESDAKLSEILDRFENSIDTYRRVSINGLDTPLLPGERRSIGVDDDNDETPRQSYAGLEGGLDARSSLALDSLASELESLRTQWETTKSNRLSTAFDFERGGMSGTGSGSGMGLGGKKEEGAPEELNRSLAMWRMKLEREEEEARRDGEGTGK